MKVKEISRTANVAWSPSALQSIHLACGTVAQQLDATFSTSAKLEIFSLDLASPGLDMPLLGAIESPQRFHKLVWSAYGIQGAHPSGLVIGGSDNGTITMWSADRIISDTPDALVSQTNQHVGAVRSLDVNPFQPNLLASGASESEIFIWDLNTPSSAMSPGNKIYPLEDVSGVAWNRQVQHILASTLPGGRSVVWDLRKNEPIIQVADSTSHMRCSAIAWHPDIATQMATASGDDHVPIIQVWDLRYATAPMRTLEHHKRGILSLAWCPQDSDLLLSAAKDNQVFCWNPNSQEPGGEVVYELPATSQWIFECHWCPRNPAIISTASFDGHVSMYSLLGGKGGGANQPAEQRSPPVATDDIFAGIAAKPHHQPVNSSPLKKPPKWFRRPCGAKFTFGGKLVSFENSRDEANNSRNVYISQVVTEHSLLQRSSTLEESLSRQQFGEFCEQKVQESSNAHDKNIWNFLKVTFEPEPRRNYLRLLGYDTAELSKKFSTWSKMSVSTLPSALDVQELSQKLSILGEEEEREKGKEGTSREESETSSTAALFGSEGESRAFDALSANMSAEASTQSSKKVSSASFMGATSSVPQTSSGFAIPVDSDADGMLCQALLVGNFEAAVDICISADRMVEAMVLAVAGGSDLLQRTQQVVFQKKQNRVSKLLSAVVNRNWTELTRHGNLDNWREILAALVTYASPEDFAPLCDLLGERLESEQEGRYRDNASLCYICSGNVDKFVECWNVTAGAGTTNGLVLQDLVEKVVLLRRAVERERRQLKATSSPILSEKLRAYAGLLASQGSLTTALTYLQQSGVITESSRILCDQLFHAQGCTTGPVPEFPFQAINVQPPLPPTPDIPAQDNLTPSQPSHAQAGSTGLTQGPGIITNPYARSLAGSHQHTPSVQPPSSVYGYGPPVNEPSGITNPSFGSTVYSNVGQPSSRPPYNDPSVPPSDPQARMRPGVGQVTPPMGPPPGIFNPAAAVPEPMPPPPPMSRNEPPGATPVWNDPPLVRSKQPTSSTAAPPAPIMAPIMAPVVAPIQDPQPPLHRHHHPSHPPPSTGQQNQPSPITNRPPSPPPTIQKPPIPQEHMIMVTSFDAMLSRCKGAANTTAMKRKTDDISRKLTTLYDLLRESKLSPDVLQGLHYIAQDAQNMNYQSGLMRHTQMVSAGNFSEISSFMPGIKALLQLGLQLRV